MAVQSSPISIARLDRDISFTDRRHQQHRPTLPAVDLQRLLYGSRTEQWDGQEPTKEDVIEMPTTFGSMPNNDPSLNDPNDIYSLVSDSPMPGPLFMGMMRRPEWSEVYLAKGIDRAGQSEFWPSAAARPCLLIYSYRYTECTVDCLGTHDPLHDATGRFWIVVDFLKPSAVAVRILSLRLLLVALSIDQPREYARR